MGFHSYEVPRVVRFTETEGRMVAARKWGAGGNGKPVFSGDSFTRRKAL